MKIKVSAALAITAVCVLVVLGVLTFAAGGIVARHHISPLVTVVDAAETGVKTVVSSVQGESDSEEYFTSAYYHLKSVTHETSETGKGDNVGFAPLGDGYLIGQRAGQLKHVQIDDSGVSVRPLNVRIPTNKDRFVAETEGMNQRLHVQFGVKDVFIQPSGDQLRLYASHHYWHAEERCWSMRLSMLETSTDELLAQDGADSGNWQTLYDTEPCAELTSEPNHSNEDNTFLHSGGRLELLDDSRLLMSVGDHFWDGQHNENRVQDPSADNGKVLLIELGDDATTTSARMYTMGHRNPQGLYVDRQGTAWLTEQGPRGGDELNVLREGHNYGWPHVSYGTDYAGVDWPDQFDWAGHSGDYTKPLWSWVPSIASNNIIRLEDSNFPLWQGNLMVTSLKDQSIHRMMLAEDRVVAIERIHIGDRIRDLMQTADGNLLLLSDGGKLIAIQPANQDQQGEMSQEQRAAQLWVQCDSCHSLQEEAGHSAGPNLHDIVGSEIARFDDYNYSEALRQLDGHWTADELDAFLQNPQEYAPGTAMAFPGLEDPQDRHVLIEYLQQQ